MFFPPCIAEQIVAEFIIFSKKPNLFKIFGCYDDIKTKLKNISINQ